MIKWGNIVGAIVFAVIMFVGYYLTRSNYWFWLILPILALL